MTDNGNSHRVVAMNPKAITDSQMYGVKDPISEEWTPGVFASIWAKYNNRTLKYTTWIVCDGPVDAIWIESLTDNWDPDVMVQSQIVIMNRHTARAPGDVRGRGQGRQSSSTMLVAENQSPLSTISSIVKNSPGGKKLIADCVCKLEEAA